MEDQDGILAIKIIVAFLIGIVIIYLAALSIGENNKENWFRKRRQANFLNRRGLLGERCHFGYPCTWQGVIVMVVMYGIIILIGYEIIFKL